MVIGQQMLTSTRLWTPENLSYLHPAPTVDDGRKPMVETPEAWLGGCAVDVSVFFGLEPFNHIKPQYQRGLFRFPMVLAYQPKLDNGKVRIGRLPLGMWFCVGSLDCKCWFGLLNFRLYI